MTKEELKANLSSFFERETDNCYPKKSYLREGIPTIGLFSKELDDTFYFYNEYNTKYYVLLAKELHREVYPLEEFGNYKKYQIPLSLAVELKPIEEFKEQEDNHFMGEVTLRDLAALLLKKPISNKKWLNEVINSQ